MVIYRRMTPEDVPVISRLEEETFSMPWSAPSFLEMISKEDARYYVAEKDGKILGGCGVLMIAGEGNITNVVIAPEARNQGIGTAMLRHLMAEGDRRLIRWKSGSATLRRFMYMRSLDSSRRAYARVSMRNRWRMP